MDLKDIMPLLMKNSNPQMAGMMNAMSGGDTSKAFEQMLGADSKNKDLLTMINLMNQSKKNRPFPPSGLKPIYPFVSDKILGVMVKYYG